jgi:hypothetical protein
MPSPKRIFRTATTAEIEAAYAAALERLTNGAFTSLSGEGHSSSKQFAAPEIIMMEAEYELAIRNETLPPSRTNQDFSKVRVHNSTVSE